MPAEAFRLTRVAVHPSDLDVACFRTSGTTQSESGLHYMRRLDTYRELSVAFGRRALFSSLGSDAMVAALAPRPSEPITSSLSCMMRFFMQAFAAPGERPERWLVSDTGVELKVLRGAIDEANQNGQPLLLLATELVLAWSYRDAFAPMLKARTTPAAARASRDIAAGPARAAA